jgi:hypothetical protein
MLAQGARFALTGVVLGTGLAWWMGRLMSGYVYQVSAANGIVLGGSALVVALVPWRLRSHRLVALRQLNPRVRCGRNT